MKRIVVADASPLHYLILIDCADILGKIFDSVLIPSAVLDELNSSAAPTKIKNWFHKKKSWLSIEIVKHPQTIRGLHKGETEALQLALQIKALTVLMDDLDGRAAAKRLGITVIGTLGLLEHAAELELIYLPETIAKVRQTNFFISEELLDAALERDEKRRRL